MSVLQSEVDYYDGSAIDLPVEYLALGEERIRPKWTTVVTSRLPTNLVDVRSAALQGDEATIRFMPPGWQSDLSDHSIQSPGAEFDGTVSDVRE